jgi:hypothetical protein
MHYILREINSDKIVGYVCIKIKGTKKQLELSMSVCSRQQSEVTPVIPFESKKQYCQQFFLITLYLQKTFLFLQFVKIERSNEILG